MKKLIYLSAVVVLFAHCTPEHKKIPKDILPVDSMKIIVWQLIEAGDYATFLKRKDTTIKSFNTAYFNQVLQLHRLDKPTFFKSFDFYQSNPYFNNILFDSVNAYAQRQRSEIYKLKE
jgi:hypothetical protein